MKLAKSYAEWSFDETKAYNKNGKMYVHATHPCDRCVKGIYICRVENGQPVPHPAFGGVCLKCGGSGILSKEVRLYTDKEYNSMENANIKAAEKRQATREEKMRAEFDEKRIKWLEENGFNKETNVTYVYFLADSYQVKDTLKDAGFKFNGTLFWHIAEVPAGYEDKVIKVKLDDVVEISAWGEGHYSMGSKEKVEKMMREARPKNPSNWLGTAGDKVYDIIVTIVDIHGYHSKYGYGRIFKFVTEEGNILKWFTSSNVNFDKDDVVSLSATIKEVVEDKYEDYAKVTIVTRAKLKAV